MRKLFHLIVFVAGLASGFDGVIATKVIEPYWSISMSDSTWSNCSYLWSDASVPVQNQGLTNAQWRNFAVKNTNNLRQTVVASQPSYGYTSNYSSWVFDGVDDYLTGPTVALDTNDFIISVDVFSPMGTNVLNYDTIFCSGLSASASADTCGIAHHSSTNLLFVWSANDQGGTYAIQDIINLFPGWHTVQLIRKDGVLISVLDGTNRVSRTTNVTYSAQQFIVGGLHNSRYFKGSVKNITVNIGTNTVY